MTAASKSPVITIVDDALDSRILVQAMIRKIFPEAQIIVTASISEAVTSIREQPPSLLITDLYLRNETGLDLLGALPLSARDFPVLVISFDHRPDRVRALFEAGADDYMHKPLELTSFKGKVETLLSRSVASARQVRLVENEEMPATLRLKGRLLAVSEKTIEILSPFSVARDTVLGIKIPGADLQIRVSSCSADIPSGKFRIFGAILGMPEETAVVINRLREGVDTSRE